MQDMMDYAAMAERAMRDLVRQALTRVAATGLPGTHHLYIGFQTDHPDVMLPPRLQEQYPHSLTIVLQNQFWNLECSQDAFEVDLNFNRKMERIRVPFEALLSFTDPSVNFSLRFQPKEVSGAGDDPAAPARLPTRPRLRTVGADEMPPEAPVAAASRAAKPRSSARRAKPSAAMGEPIVEAGDAGNVVTLDAFRKKKQRPTLAAPPDGDSA